MNTFRLIVLIMIVSPSLQGVGTCRSHFFEEIPCSSYRSPVWSPNGNFIAFTALCVEERDILVADLTSGEILNLTNTPDMGELDPVWAPDSKQIAYVRVEIPGQPEIWITSRSGANQRNITEDLDLGDRFSHSTPAWSPDGHFLAFTSQNSNQSDIAIVNLETQEVMIPTIDLAGLFYQPIWSIDGEYLAFISLDSSSPGLWVITFDTLQIRQLTSLVVDMYAWSPRDNTITALIRGVEKPVNTITVDGAVSPFESIVLASDAPLGIGTPTWSNMGGLIAFTGSDDYIQDIWIAEPENRNIFNLTNSPDVDERSPSWSPDDTQIAFASNKGSDGYHIWIINTDGSNLIKLTGN